MRILMFYQSAWSDWNHGNAHFLRGVATELVSRGHTVEIFEPMDSWSYQNLIESHGAAPLRQLRTVYPKLNIARYHPEEIDLPAVIEGANLVIVHEWNPPDLVRRIGEHHAQHSNFRLLFHDTHHRFVTAREEIEAYDLRYYDGVLAFGEVLRELYEQEGRTKRAWTWHEAADVRVFYPRPKPATLEGDLVWIGNWGDGERADELKEFLIEPAETLELKARVHGVRYPESARKLLAAANIEYAGWVPNFCAPEVFAKFRFTVHVPRQPYAVALPGIPTIRVFEALACGIPLVCSPWHDAENLFTPGKDFLVVRTGDEMTQALRALSNDPDLARDLVESGLETIRSRHTCAHRVDELLTIYHELTPSETLSLTEQ
jgi:spore maturation protein CgeB